MRRSDDEYPYDGYTWASMMRSIGPDAIKKASQAMEDVDDLLHSPGSTLGTVGKLVRTRGPTLRPSRGA